MKTPRAIFFDLDDTILDFGGARDCWRHACTLHSDRCGDVRVDQMVDAIVSHGDWYWSDAERHRHGRLNALDARRQIVSRALLGHGIEDAALVECVATAYLEARESGYQLFPESLDVLNHLRGRSFQFALITNGSSAEQRRKIDRFGLLDYFHCVCIEEEFGVGKPDRRVFEHALSSLRVHASEAWMVGDNLEWDIGGAQQLGITGIWRDVAGDGLPPGSKVRPHRIIRSLQALTAELESLEAHP